MNRNWSPEGMIGPMLCGAMVAPQFQGFLNSLWNWNAGNFTTDYYDSELQLLPMIVASGNWWNPWRGGWEAAGPARLASPRGWSRSRCWTAPRCRRAARTAR